MFRSSRSPRSSPLATVALALLALSVGLLASCDGLVDEFATQEVAVAALVATPDATHPVTGERIAGLVNVTVYFGSVSTGAFSAAGPAGTYVGFSGASVHLVWNDPRAGAKDLVIPEVAPGEYVLESTANAELTYAEVEYTLSLVHEGKTYRLKVVAPPETAIAEVAATADGVIRDHVPGSPMTVTRVGGQGPTENPIAFVSLASLSATSRTAAWTNAPSTSSGFLDLVLDDAKWRGDAFAIPGSQFKPGSAYLLSLAPMERGAQVSGNGATALFFGSAFFAGIATGGSVVVP